MTIDMPLAVNSNAIHYKSSIGLTDAARPIQNNIERANTDTEADITPLLDITPHTYYNNNAHHSTSITVEDKTDNQHVLAPIVSTEHSVQPTPCDPINAATHNVSSSRRASAESIRHYRYSSVDASSNDVPLMLRNSVLSMARASSRDFSEPLIKEVPGWYVFGITWTVQCVY